MQVHVIPVTWEDRKAEMCALRHEVFTLEQNIPEALETDDQDATSEHFLALDSAGLALGCARLTEAGQIGRMAVAQAQRGRGIGMQLLQATIAAGQKRHLGQLFLHAQSHAEAFYRKAGFLTEGEPFEEAGIPHVNMTMALPIPFAAPELPKGASITNASPNAAANSPTTIDGPPPTSFSDETGAFAALEQCLPAARRRLALLSPTLDPILFDQRSVYDALSEFARSSTGAYARILIYSSKLMVARGHVLLELVRRLDDKIQIRKVPSEYARDERSFAVWDQRGYWLLPNADDYQGLATGNDPVMAARLLERFDYLWEKARPDPDLRTLKL